MKGTLTHVFWIAAIATFYIVVAVFEIDFTAFHSDTDKAPSATVTTNPLLDIPPAVFFSEAQPLVEAHPSGKSCAQMWERGDPGSLDCNVLSHRIAKRFHVDSHFVANSHLWNRYYTERSRAVSNAIINL